MSAWILLGVAVLACLLLALLCLWPALGLRVAAFAIGGVAVVCATILGLLILLYRVLVWILGA